MFKLGAEAVFPQRGRISGLINSLASTLRLRPLVKEDVTRPKVVVIGSGWGGFQCLEELDARLFDITVVSTRDHMCFTPLLAGAATVLFPSPQSLNPFARSS